MTAWCNRAVYPFLQRVSRCRKYGAAEEQGLFPYMSYSLPPNKSVEKDFVDKLTIIIAIKRNPYAFLEGNHPVYVLIPLPKAENPNKFRDIGPFHTNCVMMTAIYKRSKGSELGEVLVAGGVIAEGSVDRALKGKHYKGDHCALVYAFISLCGRHNVRVH